MVDGEVRCYLHRHGGHDDRVVPELGVVQDVGQADEGHVLGEKGRRLVSGLSLLAVVAAGNVVSVPWRRTVAQLHVGACLLRVCEGEERVPAQLCTSLYGRVLSQKQTKC